MKESDPDGMEDQGRRLAEAWARNRGELVRGDVVAADEVPSRSLVRDGDGTFYHRRDQFGQVARGAGPWRVWGDVKRFHWFKRGLFEIVALDVHEAAAAAELAELGREHEAQFGVPDFGLGSLMVKVLEVREVVRIAISNRPKKCKRH